MRGSRKRASSCKSKNPINHSPIIRRLTHDSECSSRRRISAMVGMYYSILVSLDGTKESWKAFHAAMYFFDSAKDVLSTITIKDSNTPNDIQSTIKDKVTAAFPDLNLRQLQTTISNQNDESSRQRILDMVSKHNYDLLALGMPGFKNDDTNPQRIFGSVLDLSVRASTCTTLISPSSARVPCTDESAVYVVVIDGSTTNTNTYETVRAWMKEGDYLYVIQIEDPRGAKPDSKIKMRTSSLGRQYAMKLSDREKGDFSLLTGHQLVPAIIEYCNLTGAHFLFCGADQMWTWAKKGQTRGAFR